MLPISYQHGGPKIECFDLVRRHINISSYLNFNLKLISTVNDTAATQHPPPTMICTPCLRLLPTSTPLHRLFYSTSRSPPPATSTSAAQPFSTPFTPSPYPSTSPTHPQKHPSSAKSTAQQQPVQSSLKAGTLLKGLAFEKNKEPPVAREDAEYPDWLWGLLGKGGVSGEEGGKGGGDAFCMSSCTFP